MSKLEEFWPFSNEFDGITRCDNGSEDYDDGDGDTLPPPDKKP